nr:immunoglobulin heavy chain junction region [Macaca mulatta]MOV87239.1 immunoglobulin heavy chain junction region [Macaca mulatta]MOV91038.1 immunoglobulin heavy chain junction region [Macaca mulatta]
CARIGLVFMGFDSW